MRPRRRKIRLDRGDTLGGTVPLLMRDDVSASQLTGRSLGREPGAWFGWRGVRWILGLVGLAGLLAWLYSEWAATLGLPKGGMLD